MSTPNVPHAANFRDRLNQLFDTVSQAHAIVTKGELAAAAEFADIKKELEATVAKLRTDEQVIVDRISQLKNEVTRLEEKLAQLTKGVREQEAKLKQ